MPEKTLAAFADHGRVTGPMARDDSAAEAVLAEFAKIGVNEATLAARLQREGTASFDTSWHDLLKCLAAKQAKLAHGNGAHAAQS
jgi:transaldolase